MRKSGSLDSSISLDWRSEPRVQDSDCHCMMRYLSEEVPQLGLLYEPVVYKTVIVTVPE